MDTNTVSIDEELALKRLQRKVPKEYYSEIVTTGRGGLSVCQRLAYVLDIPVRVISKDSLPLLTENSLYVDDIVDTGKTIGLIPRNVDVASLVTRKTTQYKPTYSGLYYYGEEYIKFSWEVN